MNWNSSSFPKRRPARRTISTLTSQLAERIPPMDYPPLNGGHVTVDAACGIGHRLLRNAQIFHSARSAGYSVGVSWFPWADLFEDTDEYFASPTERAPAFSFHNEAWECKAVMATENDPTITLYNDLAIPSFLQFDYAGCADEWRWGKEVFGPAAPNHSADFHLRLASQLRSPWARRIDDFLVDAVGARRLVGIHLRTGNGETGDFNEKKRNVSTDEIMTSFARELDRYSLQTTAILVASDSNEPVRILREKTDHHVVAFSTALPASGHTVGDWVAPNSSDALSRQGRPERIHQFFEAYADLLLLAMADDLYAGAWSSFLAGPFLMNRRLADLGTTLTIYDRRAAGWRSV